MQQIGRDGQYVQLHIHLNKWKQAYLSVYAY